HLFPSHFSTFSPHIFPGNVTLRREVRGCVRNASCDGEFRGDNAVSLTGSCCEGDLCNFHSPNKTFFSPDLPRLELLPHGHSATPEDFKNTTE
ncbi:LYPD3 protein, partial [Grantiella picta]|nr:LYPD3 protein [Grantiella picta]